MSPEGAFYLLCAVFFGLGLVITAIGALVANRWERVGAWGCILGTLCLIVARFMTLKGP